MKTVSLSDHKNIWDRLDTLFLKSNLQIIPVVILYVALYDLCEVWCTLIE